MFEIICVAGARPNFPKIAPLMRALRGDARFSVTLVHTGQHYDDALSRVFFDELHIPRPDIELEVGSGSQARQTAQVMERFEPVLAARQPHAVIVVGDVNSTVACALVTAKFHRDRPFATTWGQRTRPLVVHVEAGLRSRDWDMPEEINRIVTDRISDLLLVSDPDGVSNLGAEGIPADRVHYVGNVMIDTLLAARERAMGSDVLERLGLRAGSYGLVTLHRPSNVDDPEVLRERVSVLDELSAELPLVFPVHPRTRARLASIGLSLEPPRWRLIDPAGYLDFLKLMAAARLVLTDSGGIQEETTILGVPCVTLRDNTERPVTLHEGTNLLAGTSQDGIRRGFARALAMQPHGRVPRLWDGRTAERVRDILAGVLERRTG
jgi:UDP-N-acetylglucosamine 2-epimerase (non-hydrolysing)